MNMDYPLFATTPLHMEDLLKAELASLGTDAQQITPSGVYFRGDLDTIYRVCLSSRIANRILLSIASFTAESPEELYTAAAAIPWDTYFSQEKRIKIHADVRSSRITHSHYAAQVIKDAVADYFRKVAGVRPSVDVGNPDVIIRLFLKRDVAHLSLDLSGRSLSRRGYRKKQGAAPLKENTAAALLLRAGWPELAKKGYCLIDPMCGSGTLLIEAALMAGGIAPGSYNETFGFSHLKLHKPERWEKIRSTLTGAGNMSPGTVPPLFGFDIDGSIIHTARENIRAAGLTGVIQVSQKDLAAVYPPAECPAAGLLVTNPPYGVRIGEDPIPNFRNLGKLLKERFEGWQASILTLDKAQSKAIGLKAFKTNVLYNGSIQCFLAHFSIDKSNTLHTVPAEDDAGKTMFLNRLQKNKKRLKKWIREQDITCYRLYDADMPEYNVALDIFEQSWVIVQEYAPPPSIDPAKAEGRLALVLSVVPEFLSIPKDRVILKQRKKQKGRSQYEKKGDTQHDFTIVRESGLKFYIDPHSYIDAGLFLDHRETRQLIRKLAKGKRFLNLFSYTGSATVYAAAGGAVTTTSVDQSSTYQEWGKQNCRLNGYAGSQHRFILSDCMTWLETDRSSYDLVFLDPPTFSNRKGGRKFSVQEDYIELVHRAAEHLSPGGIMIFSTNYRRFKLEEDKFPSLQFENITESTIPPDFSRNRKIHHAWLVTKKGKPAR